MVSLRETIKGFALDHALCACMVTLRETIKRFPLACEDFKSIGHKKHRNQIEDLKSILVAPSYFAKILTKEYKKADTVTAFLLTRVPCK